jgi:hypothetical protein
VKIPPVHERELFYDQVARECMLSRDDRVADYERLRSYYLFGCDIGDSPATYNKILPQMDLLVSFLFAAETTKFGIVLGESAGAERDIVKVPALQSMVNNKWQDSNADVQFGQGILWALVYASMFVKMIQRKKQTIPYLAGPGSMGVLREDMPFLDDQEAICNEYSISKYAFDRLLASHPRRAEILAGVHASMSKETSEVPAAVGRIIMSTFPMVGTPNGPGSLTMPGNFDAYRARVADERVQMRELWIWDDDANDYRTVTMASGGLCVYDRPNIFLAGEHPFIQICPNPAYDYFWGHSEVDRLTDLQDLREYRMNQIKELLDRQVKPPTSSSGMFGVGDETSFARQVFGGNVGSVDPTSQFKVWYPTVPADTFTEIRAIDEMFNEMTGLSNVTQGKGESGVRSKGHAAELARLGSSRIRKRAFTIEDGLDKMGTLYLKLSQQHDDTHLVDELGQPFIAEQFTKDAVVKIDGHSSSPLFVEDQKALARELLESKSIDRAEFIEMTDPPGKQVKLEKLKKIMAAEKKAHEEEQKLEAAKLKSVK